MANTTRHPSLLLDFAIVFIGVALVIASSKYGLEAGHSAAKGAGAILGGIYLIYLGVLFLLSYFFPGACYVFSLLTFVCEFFSRPASRRMAWFYFALCVFLGSTLLLIGLNIV